MIQIVVVTHGGMAEGMMQSVRMLIGDRENLRAVTFAPDMGIDELEEVMEGTITEVSAEREYLILCDIRGGTPFNVASRYSFKNDHVSVIYGVNLPILIDAVIRCEGAVLADLVRTLEEEAAGTIGLGKL